MNFEALINAYTRCKSSHFQEAKQHLHSLKIKVSTQHDEVLYARLAYYEAEVMYYEGRLENAYEHIQEHCLPTLRKKSPSLEVSLAYNLMAIVKQAQGECLRAVELYMRGMETALERSDYGMYGSILNNISNIYGEYKDYEKAIEFLLLSIDAYEKEHKNSRKKMTAYLNLALTYARTEHFDEVDVYYKRVCAMYTPTTDAHCDVMMEVLKALRARHAEDREACITSVKAIIAMANTTALHIENFKEVTLMCQYTSFFVPSYISEELFSVLQKKGAQLRHIELELLLCKTMIQYFTHLGDEDKITILTRRFYELSNAKELRSARLLSQSINTMFEVRRLAKDNDEVRADMLRLQAQSQRDPLTSLLNRSALESSIAVWFEHCKRTQTPFGAEIIDVDYFKQYNDAYGHLAGDDCLRTLAHKMECLQNENVMFIRYGGDEFLAFYKNMKEEEVAHITQLLQREVQALHIVHEATKLPKKCVSITQGIHYGVPSYDENVYDFIRLCDESLYTGKNTRSSIIFNERLL